MSDHQPTISDAEWRVMQVLWGKSPRTAADVVDVLADKQNWRPRTVKTMLNRLVKKGALTFEQDGKRYLYQPAVTREQAVRHEVGTLRDRVFDGAAAPMLSYLIEQQDLSREQIDELKRILDEHGG